MSQHTLRGQKALWRIEPTIPDEIREALDGESVMLAHLLYCRGFRTAEEIRAFFNQGIISHDPFLLPDMPEAVDRIARAVDNGERVAVYGDFDCDGITAAAALVSVLHSLGLDPIALLPTREDGHGLHPSALAELADQDVRLIVTADCGVTSIEEVRVARGMGMDVIVTDHHQVRADGSLPDCLAIASTRHDSHYPCPFLCGVGIAYKLAQALAQRFPHALDPDDLLDLVALGTIADIVPLRDENRSLVVRGLRRLRETRRPGLLALFQAAGVQAEKIDPVAVGFYLAPRINAANRMATPQLAYDLITSTDDDEAAALAEQLSAHNQRRQVLVAECLEQIVEHIGAPADLTEQVQSGRRPPLLVVIGDWAAGISGLLASKLVDAYGVPAFVGTDGGTGTISVSGRSIPGVRIDSILEQSEAALPGGIFLGYGGHAGAAGFSVDRDRLDVALGLIEAQVISEVPVEEIGAVLTVDAEVNLSALTIEAAQRVRSLAPFGVGFSQPLFLVRGVKLQGIKPLSSNKHVKARLSRGGVSCEALWFNVPEAFRELPRGAIVDVVFHLEVNEWGGVSRPQLRLRDWRLPE